GCLNLTKGRADSVSSCLHRFRHNGRPGSHGLQTTLISTSTQRPFFVNADMTNIPRGTITTAMDLSIGNNACTNPGSYFYKNKMIDTGPIPGSLFPQGHKIYIIINHHKR